MDYLEAMRHFVAAAEGGSFSRVATEMGVKVSTVSRHIAALEDDLGAALFNRSTRRLHLTEAGHMFLRRSRLILDELNDARQTTREWNGRAQGLLKLAIPGALARLHIIPALPAFFAQYPDVRLDLLLDETVVDPLQRGLDAIIRIGTLPDSALIARRLADAPNVLVGAPSLIGTGGPPARPEDLNERPVVALHGQAAKAWHWHRPDGTQGAVTLRPLLVSDDADALRGAALAGVGFGLLPRWLVADALASGALEQVLPTLRWGESALAEPAIWLLYPPKKIVSPKLRAFMEFAARQTGTQAGAQAAKTAEGAG